VKGKQFAVAIAAIAVLVMSWPAQAGQVPCPDCDLDFGDGGLAFGASGLGIDIVVQPDGKTLLLVSQHGESYGESVTVERLDVDGSFDGGFGFLGIAELPFPENSLLEYPSAMTLAPDLTGTVEGDFDIVVSGYVRLPATSTNTRGKGKKNRDSFTDHMVIARLNSDGSMETGFGTGGVRMLDAASSQPADAGIAVDPEGRILASARFGSAGAVFRVAADGSGTIEIFDYVARAVGSIAVVPSPLFPDDDSYYVLGHTPLGLVVRWTDDGTLDPYFGPNDNGQIDVPGTYSHMAVASDGSVFVVSIVERESGKGRKKTRWNEVVVRRYDKDGKPYVHPAGFPGYAPYSGGGPFYFIEDLEIDPEGRVVAVVDSYDDTGNNHNFEGVVRWDPDNGSMDEPFGYAFSGTYSGTSFTGVSSYHVAFNPPDDGKAPPEYAKDVMVLGGWTRGTGSNDRPTAIRMLR